MSAHNTNQIERKMDAFIAQSRKPWAEVRSSMRWLKKVKHRKERRTAQSDPECLPMYRKYTGYVW